VTAHFARWDVAENGSFIPFLFFAQEKCAQYWPSDRSARYQCFVVDPLAEYNMPQYLLREFKVTDARDGSSRTVRQFQVRKNGGNLVTDVVMLKIRRKLRREKLALHICA
jgi:protein tyrosine phosphatase